MVDVHFPIVLPQSADDYISGYATATLQVEYDTASTFDAAPGTATAQTVVTGTERYEFDVSGVTSAHYYRWRVAESDSSTAYDWATFRLPTAYATVQEVVRAMDFPDTSREDELDALLIQATDYITEVVCGGRSFFRDPVGSGTTTLTLDIDLAGVSSLSLGRSLDLDIISLTSVGVAEVTGGGYTTLAADSTGYYLTPGNPRTNEPYTDISLSDVAATFTTFPTGRRIVQLIGAFGWPAIPSLVNKATVDLTRQWWERGPSDSDPVGMSAFGSPVFGPGTPKSVRDLAKSRYSWHGWVG